MEQHGYWYENSVFYHIYPLGMTGAPLKNEGLATASPRILQVLDWIPHLKNLGIGAVYFGPLWESGTHGYDTHDYYKLDQRLGTNDDFKKVCEALHNADIKVVLDGVFNHVGRGHFAFQDVIKNRETSLYKDWFAGMNFGWNNSYNDNFSYESWSGCEELVKLNLYHSDVKKHILDAVAMWMDTFHIDGLRLDAADCIQRDFFRELHSFVKTRREDFWLMGEIIHGNYRDWANPEMMDSVTNYECWKGIYSSHNDKNYFEIAHSLNRQFGKGGIYEGLRLYNFVDNHDVNRIASLLNDKDNLSNVYTLLFTMPGMPSIYYGSEWGIEGTKAQGADADVPLRPAIDIHEMKDVKPDLIAHISKLSSIYRESVALQFGEYENIEIRNLQLAYARCYQDKYAVVALNLSDEPSEFHFQYHGQQYDISLGAFENVILD